MPIEKKWRKTEKMINAMTYKIENSLPIDKNTREML